MARRTASLLPATGELLRGFGNRLRLARLRRKLSAKQLAERAGMAPMTLRSLERGGSGVTIGAYLAVMQVLGIEQDLALLAQADPMGRDLQDARLSRPRERAAPGVEVTVPERAARKLLDTLPHASVKDPAGSGLDWMEKSGFASSKVLSELIDPIGPRAKKKR